MDDEALRSLVLVDLAGPLLPIVKETSATGSQLAFFVNGALCGFPLSVPPNSVSDVLDCLTLARLAANAKADRYENYREWRQFYDQVLQNVGWVLTEITHDVYGRPDYKTASDFLRSLAMSDANGAYVYALAAVLEKVQGFPRGTQEREHLERYCQRDVRLSCSFVISTFDDGILYILELTVEARGDFLIRRVAEGLSPTIGDVVNISIARMHLNEDVYSRVREGIRKKVEKVDVKLRPIKVQD